MVKRKFVKLFRIGSLWPTDAKWQRNVHSLGVQDDYAAVRDNGFDTQLFAADDIEFADITVYAFSETEYDLHYFYVKDCFAVQSRATGFYYALLTDDLFDV